MENMPSNKNKVWFSNFIFLSGILFCVLGIAYYINCYKLFFLQLSNDVSLAQIFELHWYKYIVFFAIFSILLILGLRLRISLKIILSQWLLASFLALYGIEFFLYFSQSENKIRSDYVKSLRDGGIDAYQALGSDAFTRTNGLKTNEGKRILPLGGVSNKPTVVHRSGKNGSIANAYESDEHGFNNIKGMYDQDGVDIVIAGTCLEEYKGMHDPSEENLGSVMRKFGYKAINLSKAGSNYLSIFAALKEYAEQLKPKATLLFYHDVEDLYPVTRIPGFSSKSPHSEPHILLRYFNEDNFTQNLIFKQDKIDSLLIKFLKSKEAENTKRNAMGEALRRIWTLHNFRSRIKLDTSRPPPDVAKPMSADFIKILEKLKNLVSNWNGELYLVRSPTFPRFKSYSKNINEADIRFKSVRKLANKLEIRVIDLREKLLNLHPEPLSLFELELHGIPNGKFYKLSGETISERLRQDGVL